MERVLVFIGFLFCQVSLAKDVENREFEFVKNTNLSIDCIGPIACCTRIVHTGEVSTKGYVKVNLTMCAVSDISYQDAYARACALVEASSSKALQIAIDMNKSVKIGGF